MPPRPELEPTRGQPPGPSRRGVLSGLVVGAGILTTGCSLGGPDPLVEHFPRRAVEPDPDVGLAALAFAGERAALEVLESNLSQHPGLRPSLSPMLSAHRAHISLLADAVPDKATPAPGVGVPPAAMRVPAGEQAALAVLASKEHGLSVATRRYAAAAQSGALARLLASMAASAEQHATLLRPAPSAVGSP